MHKKTFSGVAALGLVAVGLSLMRPAPVQMLRADTEGSGADVQGNRHIVANAGYVRSDSQLLADSEGSGADVQANPPSWSRARAKPTAKANS